jgi:hypothetical protein
VAPSATGVQIGVFITNAVPITGLVLPLEIRTMSGGAYMAAGGFTRDHTATGRLANSPLGNADGGGAWPAANITRRTFAVSDLTGAGCLRPSDPTLGWNTGAALPDFVSPDAIFHGTVSTGDPNIGELIVLPVGSDPVGTPSYRIVCNVGAALGTFRVDTTCVRPANHLLYTDINVVGIAPAFTAGTITVEIPANICPTPTIDNAVVAASVGSLASNDADATDPENNVPFTFSLVSGPGAVNSVTGGWSYSPLCSDIPSFQVTIGVTDTQHPGGPCANVQFTVNVSPAQLNIACGNVSAHWAAADASSQINVSGGCPPYVYAVQAGLGSVSGSGLWSYNQGCSDVGSSQVRIRATDANQSFVECTFTFAVTNTLPTCAAIPPTLAPQGELTNVNLGPALQGDGDALTYTFVSAVPPLVGWGESIVGNVFSATRPGADVASYTVNYSVYDGCARAECSFDLIFESPCISVVDAESREAYDCALNGEQATVCIVAEPGAIPGLAGGFDFLICYDQSGLSFLGASGGPTGWEYFTYRTGMFGGNCGGACPDGYIRLVSIAEMNNGVLVDLANFDLDGKTLACMTFSVTSDRNFINSCLHVGFCSYDCTDNIISNKSGNIVWTPSGGVNFGPNYGCPPDPKVDYVPAVTYCPGAICVCEPPDDRGDLNLNGIANEIGDAVLYTNYFIYGSSVWTALYANSQILASDINDDGIVLTVADLIYLIRIITGDEQPFPPGTGTGSPKVSPYANSVDLTHDVANGAVTVRTNSSVDIGAALLVFRYSGSVGAPVLANNSGMEIRSNAANGELRVLVFSSVEAAASRLTAGSNTLVTIPMDGSIELVESQFSDYRGGLLSVNAASASLPTEYALLQNYPNPFNAGTVISIQLTKESDYTLTIFNVAGQVVRTFAGNGVGTVNVEWNGANLNGQQAATGMYFYRVTTPEFTATKKMVLLK